MNAPLIAILFVVFAGCAVAMQSPINAALARHIGGSVAAAAVSFGVGFVVLVCISTLVGQASALPRITTAPPVLLIAGAFGAYFVWATLWAVPIIGSLTTMGALILGQMCAALILDSTGMLGLTVQSITPTRIMAAALVAAGVVLSRF